MSQVELPTRLQVPASLARQLYEYRRRVWTSKMLEGTSLVVGAISLAYLATFALDRVWDTPAWVRAIAFLTALGTSILVPYYYLHQWVWRYRGLKPLARLLSRKLPRVGDQLLGVLELAENKSGQQHSMRLCHAAIEQVAQDANERDFSEAMPPSRERPGLICALGMLSLWVVLLLIVPLAAKNAWARFAMPWHDTPRYTFAAVAPLPDQLVVAHGEAFALEVHLNHDTAWRPGQAQVHLRSQAIAAQADGHTYRFEIPPQIAETTLRVRVGDWMQPVRLKPMARPALTSVLATVTLPEYLQRPEPRQRDIRGGSVSTVKGSQVDLMATASRELAAASVQGQPVKPQQATWTTPRILVDESQKIELGWTDIHHLEGKDPFVLSITADEDQPPSLLVEGLPRRRVVLDSEQLKFNVSARDDFGVREVGIQWRGIENELISVAAQGDRVLASGGPEKTALDVQGTFTATSLGIEPQTLELEVFAVDYFPDRPRVLSTKYVLFVLDAEDHAIWITEQLARWHRQSLEVRDKELRLYEENKKLRELSPEDLATTESQHRLEKQAAAERANGRQLTGLTQSGEELLRQAARNPEIGVGHLDRWAEMLQILNDIAGNRMPSVATLLEQGSRSPGKSSPATANSAPIAGQNRNEAGGGQPTKTRPSEEKPQVPTIVDNESSQQPPGESDPTEPQEKNPSSPSLGLAQTTLMGKPSNKPAAPPAQNVDQAVVEQQDLLKEFEKVANELNDILANLEGSTLVKRLKAESRKQLTLADRLAEDVSGSFGTTAFALNAPGAETFQMLSEQLEQSSSSVSLIMDDMQAYFERRRMVKFKSVLDDMRKEEVLIGLRHLADDVGKEPGISMAQCEYWSDTMDRWAEDLVDPSNCGACPGGRSRGSLPPSIVLEVLKILEGEINLREETRVAEQARQGLKEKLHREEATRLQEVQQSLGKRVNDVVDRILELPGAETEFGREINLLRQVDQVMIEAAEILATPETGAPAIAAETEAIELLLKSKRINPNGGGGGGSDPGGGGTGTTQDSALALLGAGLNENEVKQAPAIVQSTGTSGDFLPEEFRAGLDEYFHQIETPEDRR